MDLYEFNVDYFDPLMGNILSLMGDFNIVLLKVNIDTPATNVLIQLHQTY